MAGDVLRRGDEGRVGQGVRDPEAPGGVVLWRVGCQPVNGLTGGGGVVAHVLGLTDARIGGGVEVVALARHVGAQRAVEVANAFLDVHGDALVREARVVVRATEVQLADGGDGVAPLHKPVAPAGSLANVGGGVVPDAELVGVAAGGQAGARRHADGEVAVGGIEADAASGQGVQVWGVCQRMAVAAGRGASVLIGGYEQEIQRIDSRHVDVLGATGPASGAANASSVGCGGRRGGGCARRGAWRRRG